MYPGRSKVSPYQSSLVYHDCLHVAASNSFLGLSWQVTCCTIPEPFIVSGQVTCSSLLKYSGVSGQIKSFTLKNFSEMWEQVTCCTSTSSLVYPVRWHVAPSQIFLVYPCRSHVAPGWFSVLRGELGSIGGAVAVCTAPYALYRRLNRVGEKLLEQFVTVELPIWWGAAESNCNSYCSDWIEERTCHLSDNGFLVWNHEKK